MSLLLDGQWNGVTQFGSEFVVAGCESLIINTQ